MKGSSVISSVLRGKSFAFTALTASVFLSAYSLAWAEGPIFPGPLVSLKSVQAPEPSNLSEFVRDKAAAIRLGKALFWDMQVGSDGVQACASCHFHAGSDNRIKNQLSPGLRNTAGAPLSQTFNPTAAGSGGPNYTLTAADFPFHKLSDPNDAVSTVLFDTDDVSGSQGTFRRDFVNITSGSAIDVCNHQADEVFKVNGSNVRRVDARNAPSVINAVFNFRNFWDGRASNIFNGVNNLGANDPNAKIFKSINGRLQEVMVHIDSASLASQAVTPPASGELSCTNRPFAAIGKKLLAPGIIPLGKQMVHPGDGVLGVIAKNRGKGLRVSYSQLIKQAFRPAYWNSSRKVIIGNQQYDQMSANFSLFFGLAVQLYEATLVSNDAPIDRFVEGDISALNPQQMEGLELFQGMGRCFRCHFGPLFTEAALGSTNDPSVGFINIGVRPAGEDSGDSIGGKARFKTSGLRNVELTGPYLHNGGQSTLRQVMDFYNRGGDFTDEHKSAAMSAIQFSSEQQEAVIAFMIAFTDERVRWQKAPFDHPQLFIPNGHPGDQHTVSDDGTGKATDSLTMLPAVGANGAAAPIAPYMNLSPFQP